MTASRQNVALWGYAKLLQLWYDVWAALPRRRSQILFAAQQRARLEGNLLRVRDRMLERRLDRQSNLVCWTETKHRDPLRRAFRRLTLTRLMARSDVVLLDDYCRLLDYITPRRGLTIVQLWHAGFGFKAVGFARPEPYSPPPVDYGHRKYTYAICGAEFLRPVYAEVFGIDEEAIIPTGLPRLDGFLDHERVATARAAVLRQFPQCRGKRVVLFAPTFRGQTGDDAYYDYSKMDFAGLYSWCGDSAVVLVRMHHFVSQLPPIPAEYRDRIIDVSSYPETNDLLHVADVLITDYSSIVFEYCLLDRPMLFFAYDEAEYAATRGFQGDYRNLAPGRVCGTFKEVLDALRTNDFEAWKVAEYRAKYLPIADNGAADRVIDQIILPSLGR